MELLEAILKRRSVRKFTKVTEVDIVGIARLGNPNRRVWETRPTINITPH